MKTTQQIVRIALLSSLTLLTGHVLAGADYPTNPERSFIIDQPPVAKSTAEVRAELEAFRANPVTADGWHVVGGERGDAFVPPNYAGNVYQDNASSAALTPEEMKLASVYYRASM